MAKYFFRYRNRSQYPYATLVEMTPAEHRDEKAKATPDGWEYEPTTAQQAHKWVKEGGHHETALYINEEGRIRYARDGY